MSDNIKQTKASSQVSESTLIKVQAYSGLMVAAFLTMHLANATIANFGPAPYNLGLTGMYIFTTFFY